jgi:hypothetical protein
MVYTHPTYTLPGDQENTSLNENQKSPSGATPLPVGSSGRRFSFAPGGLNLHDVRASMTMDAIDMIGVPGMDLGLGLGLGKKQEVRGGNSSCSSSCCSCCGGDN